MWNWDWYPAPSSRQARRPVICHLYGEPGTKDGKYTIVTETIGNGRLNAYPMKHLNVTPILRAVKAVPVARANRGLSRNTFMRHIRTFQNGKMKMANDDDQDMDMESNKDEKKFNMNLLNGNNGPIILACFVRFLLIAHNVLTVWRVTDVYNEDLYWLMIIANFFMLLEGMIVIIRRAGMEYSWWCPCFLIYLASTIPGIWLLQLNQYDRFANPDKYTTTSPLTTVTSIPLNTTAEPLNGTSSNVTTVTLTGNETTSETTQLNTTTMVTTLAPSESVLGTLDNDVWVIIIEESLIYLLVFSRWLLPRGKVSRDFLADLLLEFLAVASDIMELLAVFDEDDVRGNLKLTYVILAVWSASFIQFIPILMQRKRFRKARNPNVPCLTRYFGDKFTEILVTCMSIFLQDLPFLVVRLYIIIEVKLITYSLIFFLLKNIVTLLLLFYRLTILCYRLPHCKGKPA